jgi:hypothetical protein
MLPLAFLSGVLHRDHWWPIVAVMLIAGMATWSQNRVFSERSNIIYDFTYRASKHFLAFGVVLFLISRLIAFYGSALKAGLL